MLGACRSIAAQMVAKGHDFPGVTLAVVADADTALYAPDLRASEHTFQLLTQLAGRAGRGTAPGRVLVQTWNPDVPSIRQALERDEDAFYGGELDVRRRLGYPPYRSLTRVLFVSPGRSRPERGPSPWQHAWRPVSRPTSCGGRAVFHGCAARADRPRPRGRPGPGACACGDGPDRREATGALRPQGRRSRHRRRSAVVPLEGGRSAA